MKKLLLVSLGVLCLAAGVVWSQITLPGTGEIVGTTTVGTSKVQWMHEQYVNLDWGGSATGDVQAVGYSALLNCQNRNKLVIKAEGSLATTAIVIRVWYFDHNATQVGVPTASFALVNSQIQEGTSNEALNASYFHFEGATMDVLPGAEQFKIQMVSVANGTGKVWGRAL